MWCLSQLLLVGCEYPRTLKGKKGKNSRNSYSVNQNVAHVVFCKSIRSTWLECQRQTLLCQQRPCCCSLKYAKDNVLFYCLYKPEI